MPSWGSQARSFEGGEGRIIPLDISEGDTVDCQAERRCQMAEKLLKRAFKYRLYPTKKQRATLQWTLDRTRELYNAALQERRDAYTCKVKRHPNYFDEETRQQLTKEHALAYTRQAAELPEIKEVRPEYEEIYSQVLQDVLRRVDKAFKAFFRRIKEGQKPGYPRYKGEGHYDSFPYPQSGFSLTEDHRVCLSKIGSLKVKFPTGKKAHPPQGVIKTCTIKREGERWFVVLTCEVEPEVVHHPSEEAVGLALGLLHFATLSTGEQIDNPRHLRRSEARLKQQQQRIARQNRDSTRRRKARSEEHTSELQSRQYLVCRLLLEKKKKKLRQRTSPHN